MFEKKFNQIFKKGQRIINQIVRWQHFVKVALILILILGFSVRLYRIRNPIADWHSWRQVDTASVSRIYLDQGINLLQPRYYDISRIQTGILNPEGLRLVEFPIFNLFHALLTANFPALNFNVWGRLVSIFASLVSTLMLFLIAKHFYSQAVGLLAAMFFAFLPYNIYFSRVILPEPLSVALGLVAVFLFIKALENKLDNKNREEGKILVLILAGIFFALATLVKPFVFFYGMPLIYLAWKKYGFKGLFTNWQLLLFADLAIIPFFAWRIWINQFPAGIPHFNWAFNGDKIRFKPSFWRWIFAERIGKLILGVWGLIPFSFGLLKIEKEKLFSHFFFFGILLYMVIFATANVRHDYYQIFAVPVIALLLAQGVWEMWQGKKYPVWASRFLVLFSLGVMFVVSFTEVRGFYQINHPEIIVAGEAADRLLPKEAIVIAPYNGDTAFLYQTRRFGYPVVDRSIETMIEQGATHFVSVNFDDNTNYVMANYKMLEKTDKYVIVDLGQKQ